MVVKLTPPKNSRSVYYETHSTETIDILIELLYLSYELIVYFYIKTKFFKKFTILTFFSNFYCWLY